MRSRIVVLLLLLLLAACGGSLSDEQRRAMREKMDGNRIVRVTELEITEAAYAEGRRIASSLDSLESDSTKLKNYLQSRGGSVRFLQPGAPNARLLEKQLLEAYLSESPGTFQDNVQKVRNSDGGFDTLLYTKPVTKNSDGSPHLAGVWSIWLPKKELVLLIGRDR